VVEVQIVGDSALDTLALVALPHSQLHVRWGAQRHWPPATANRQRASCITTCRGGISNLSRSARSGSTIRQTYTVLRAGLDGAVRDGLLARNPAAAVKRPGVERTEAKHLDAADVTAVLKAAAESRYHSALVLIAATGLRRGEVLALRWDKVDLDAGLLKVAWTIGRIDGQLVISGPKTAGSRRTVPLSPAVVEMLRRHKATQAAERVRAGNQWQDSGLVFTTELGGPVDPRNLLRVIEVAAKHAKLDGVGARTLWHSAAVAWLRTGVHIKAVADLLGHSSIADRRRVRAHKRRHGAGRSRRAGRDGSGCER
jgi:integrase